MTVSHQFPFETIVVTMDFSAKSSATLRYAQTIAQIHGAKLLLIHVIDPMAFAFPNGVPESLAADQAAREELARIEEETRKRGIGVHSIVETGDICDQILQCVRDDKGKLLVLGTRGTTEAGRVALGTIARQLLAKAPCPILTITPDAESLLPWAGQWRTVLLATDFSLASLCALSSAHRIAHEQLVVLHSSDAKTRNERGILLERLRFLAPFNESHTVPVEHFIVTGEPGEVIPKYASELRADLVVLGSPSRVLSEKDIPSSTVLQVISNVSCPVLCIPADARVSEESFLHQIEHAI